MRKLANASSVHAAQTYGRQSLDQRVRAGRRPLLRRRSCRPPRRARRRCRRLARRGWQPWRPARRARDRRAPPPGGRAGRSRRRCAPPAPCRSPTRRCPTITATGPGPGLARPLVVATAVVHPARRRRVRRRAHRRSRRSTSSRRRRGGRRDRSRGTRRARDRRAVTNRLRFDHVEPAHRERAGDRGEQPRTVGCDDRDRNAAVVAPAAHVRCRHASSLRVLDACRRPRTRGGTRPAAARGCAAASSAPSSPRARAARSAATAAAAPRSIAAAAFSNRSRSSAAFVGPHAAGPVARESPIVSRYSSRRRSASAAHVAGEVVGDRRVREVAACRDVGHQQVVADEPRDDLAAFAVESDAACDTRSRCRHRPVSGRRAGPSRCRATTRRATAAPAAGMPARRRRRSRGSGTSAGIEERGRTPPRPRADAGRR